ncbi:competence protein ComGC [Scopulibacillus darangshiensis]|uniref:ComG operon protein 3 n=1 Tax=Scopulibacillus darangshiensis TaxID=442528 RepID=A0A4R2P8B1_9BACL|nr:competence type IV pilus major pilin ComGC [Scopulibacillus darangshiensis]TCP31152.1 competence protein ComGC [Scopulibacillus darangshiensis]
MKHIKLTQDGFTLIEMMIVLMIISILLLIAVPNMIKSHDIVETKSCKATIQLVQSQIATYKVENNGETPDLATLKGEGYVDSVECPDGGELSINSEGKVVRADGEAP